MRKGGGVRQTRFLRGQNRCKWVEFERNMIPRDYGQTTVVKSAALMCMGPIYMQRIYPNGHFNGAYFMVFTPTKMALNSPDHLQWSRKTRRTWPMNVAHEVGGQVGSPSGYSQVRYRNHLGLGVALGTWAACGAHRGWGKTNSVLARSKQVYIDGIRQKHDPMGLWKNNRR